MLSRPLFHHALIYLFLFCDVKLITLPLSPSLSVAVWCESDYGGWGIRWFVVLYVCGWGDDGMLRDRWKVRKGAWLQTEASVCQRLSAVFSSGCVNSLWSVAQYESVQYLQPGIITGLQSAITVSPRTWEILITCHVFGCWRTLRRIYVHKAVSNFHITRRFKDLENEEYSK